MWIISFWLFPVVAGCMWIATLVALLAAWAADGKPIYSTMSVGMTIPYISHIGAEGLKPLFIVGSVVTVVFLDLALLSERWLRHAGQLARNKGRFDKSCAIGSIFFSIAGALGLILLSIFDTKHHHRLHQGFLAMFIASYVVCAILVCLEYIWIGRFYHPQARILLVSFGIKAAFVICELAVAIAFGVTQNSDDKKNASAVLEWGKCKPLVSMAVQNEEANLAVAALIFAFFVFSFVIDLLPSVRTKRHVPQGEKYAWPGRQTEMAERPIDF
ncbi:Frag1/DRAM/Sfk1 [Penicillium bovifimosum]|uniref:Frag1/DRAM/Sfk1 n=1 Tax=Penicillium bovifimosum TaxID=126998 RepID=A0A9W9KV92_9EURO|nr:Frag1/DRAM/Sfk1 [Penicillium bovifimosum]KAJ5121029.1 Frag1/DRAM/Sfk1 [Penicillium bovifimosum]